MNYEAHYNTLIERARTRLLEGYSERHHVVPKCMGGSNEETNLVRLTAEEHYVAHQLLVKMYPGKGKLVYALNAMTQFQNEYMDRSKNKKYGWVRKLHAETHSKRMKGKPSWIKGKKHSEETKAKMSAAAMGRIVSLETGRRISAAKKGIKFSKAHKQALSEAQKNVPSSFKGKSHTAETKRILSAKLRGRRPEQVTCPHCNKEGGKPVMTRFHFNNCKRVTA